MAALGSLVVKLALEYAQFTQGLDKSEQAALQKAKQIQATFENVGTKVGQTLGKIGGLLVAGFSVGAIVGGIKETIQALDDLNDAAAKIGLSAQVFGELGFAAKLSGSNTAELGTAIGKLNVKMQDAVAGGTKSTAVFEALGIKVGELKNLKAEEVIGRLADVFKDLPDGPQKSALAIELFGKSGANMVQMLSQGSEGIDKLRKEFVNLSGGPISEAAAASGAFNDQMDRFGVAAQGAYGIVISKLLPTVTFLAEEMGKGSRETGELTGRMSAAKIAGEFLSKVIQELVIFAAETKFRFVDAGKSIAGFAAAAGSLAKLDFSGFKAAFAAAYGDSSKGREELEKWKQSLRDVRTPPAPVGSQSNFRQSELAASQQVTAAAAAQAKAAAALNAAHAGTVKAVKDVESAYDKIIAKIEKKTALTKAEIDRGRELTDVEKRAVEIEEQLKEKKITLTAAQRAHLEADLASLAASEDQLRIQRARLKGDIDAAKAHDDYVKTLTDGVSKLQAETLAEQQSFEEIGLGTRALSMLKASRLEDQAAIIDGIAIKKLDRDLDTFAYEQYQKQSQALRDRAAIVVQAGDLQVGLADAKETEDTLKRIDEYLDPAKAQSFGDALTSALKGAGSALSGVGKAFDDYQRKQQEIIKLQKELSTTKGLSNEDRLTREAALQDKSTQATIEGFASAAGAAKGFFAENSKGYKALEGVERVFTAVQLAMSLQRAAASAIEAVLNQAKGDPYTAWARMAAMAAAVGALGFAVSGGFSSGGSSGPSAADRQAVQGTGTVFGDSSAKSDSVGKSLESLQSSSKIELTYQSGMLAALRSIDSGIKGLASTLVRTNGLTSGNSFGVETGTLSKYQGDYFFNKLGPISGLLNKSISSLPLIGGLLGKIQSMFGKVSQEITDSGLVIQGRVRDLASGVGVQQYADVKTTSSSFFGLVKDTKNQSLTGGVDDSIARQFGLIFTGIGDALKSAAGALGKDGMSVADAVANFIVEIPRASLRGLTGSALSEAVSNLISAASDQIAKAALPGLDAFQQIGEGYLQTITRVASGVESAQYALEKFGIVAIDFTNILDKQADVGAEIVRQSIVQRESYGVDAAGGPSRSVIPGRANPSVRVADELTGVGKIIESLTGSAAEIADVYASLLDVRNVMKSVGSEAIDLSQAMLRGAGGLDALKSGLDSYFDKFFNASEKTAASTARLADRFSQIGVVMPDSNAGFRKLVEGIETSTDAGQLLYGKVINLSGAFAELYPLLDSTAAVLDQTNAKRAQEIQIMELLGNNAGALAARRADELASLQAQGYDAAYLSQQRYIYALQDANAARAEATRIEQEAASRLAAITNERTGLMRQLWQLEGNTTRLRELDRNAVDVSNQSIYDQVQALTELKTAQAAAAQVEQEAAAKLAAITTERTGLMRQLWQLEGNTTRLRELDRSAISDANVSIYDQIQALTDLKDAQSAAAQAEQEAAAQLAAITDERTGLMRQLWQLEGNTTRLRELDRSAINAANVGIYDQIQALTDLQAAQAAATQAAEEAAARIAAIASERYGIETELLQAMGDTTALRARELALLDPSNRALKQQVYDTLDKIEADNSAAAAAKALQDAYKGLTDSMLSEAARIRGEITGGGPNAYATLQAQFASATAAARAGDQSAASQLPELARSVEDAARKMASSSEEFTQIRALLANSLQATAAALAGRAGTLAPAVPTFASGGSHTGGVRLVGEFGPELEYTGPSRILDAQRTSALLRPQGGGSDDVVTTLRTELAEVRAEIRNGNLGVIPHVRTSAKILKKWDTLGLPITAISTQILSSGGSATQVYTRGASWSGAGGVITLPTDNVPVTCPITGTITKATLLTQGGTGSCVVNVWKDTFGNYPPTAGDSITGGSPPAISSGTAYTNSALTGWTTTVTAGDVLMFNLGSVSNFTEVVVMLEITPA